MRGVRGALSDRDGIMSVVKAVKSRRALLTALEQVRS